jgi:hypothetical protein
MKLPSAMSLPEVSLCLGLLLACPMLTASAQEVEPAAGADAPAAASAPEADPTAEEPISEAERLLWLTSQLDGVQSGWSLHYEYRAQSTDEEPVEDEVELSIAGVNEDGSRQTSMHYFSGDRNRYVAPHEATTGNPVLGVHLQDDVYEMNRLTQGSWRYFHRKIKKALAHDAKLEPVEIDFEGARVKATRVTIQPYIYDEQRDQFDAYAEKIYEVVVSESIPGYLYEVHTVVPAREAGAPPIAEATLRLARIERHDAAAQAKASP